MVLVCISFMFSICWFLFLEKIRQEKEAFSRNVVCQNKPETKPQYARIPSKIAGKMVFLLGNANINPNNKHLAKEF